VLAIAIELLAGKYTATQFNDRSEAEWPPHPARLFSAMVAAWADSDEPDPAERAALRWLEEQDAPAIHCGEGYRRGVVTHFVPVNDPLALSRGDSWAQPAYASLRDGRLAVAAAGRSGDPKALTRAQAMLAKAEKKAAGDAAKAGTATGKETASIAGDVLAVLPEFRGKQGRTYPTVLPDSETVWFSWPGAAAGPQVMRALDGLLARVGRIGHSSTLVACRCTDREPDQQPAWLPGGPTAGTAKRVRVPRAGLTDRLELAHETHRGTEPRTLPAGMVSYQRRRPDRFHPRTPVLGGDWYILGFADGQFRYAAEALAVTRAARAALLRHAGQPPAEFLSGHQGPTSGRGRTPPLERPHLAVVPLLNAGHRHSDGTIFGLALVLPATATAGDREAVESALSAWAYAGFELGFGADGDEGGVRVKIEGLGVDRAAGEPEAAWLTAGLAGRRKTVRREYWCRPSRRWLSVTPVALDRFPGNLRSRQPQTRDRAEAEAEWSVATACVNAGLAGRAEDLIVTVRLDAPLAGLPASPGAGRGAGQFPGYRAGDGSSRACVHAEITFREPVAGPVLIGAGRYLGYGLCLPDVAAGRERNGRPRR
jgi:CRISPR-associated protein Csb2